MGVSQRQQAPTAANCRRSARPQELTRQGRWLALLTCANIPCSRRHTAQHHSALKKRARCVHAQDGEVDPEPVAVPRDLGERERHEPPRRPRPRLATTARAKVVLAVVRCATCCNTCTVCAIGRMRPLRHRAAACPAQARALAHGRAREHLAQLGDGERGG